MSQGFSIGGEAFGFGGSFSVGGDASTAKTKRNARISRDSAARDRESAYNQALIYQPQLKAAEYQAMWDAGLHPAFTGGGGTGSAPILAGGVTGPGPTRGGGGGSAASFKVVNKYEALINEANLGLIAARTDEVRERIEASQYARRSPGAPPAQPGDVNITADPQTTTAKGDKSLAAATNPAWNTKTVAPGVTMEFLGNEISENFENPVMALAFVERNDKKISYYGLKYLYSKNPMTYAKNIITWLYNQSTKPGNKTAQARKYDSRVDSRSPVRRLK